MKLYLIRHSLTEGNLHRRYIGITDEPLCAQGIELAKQKRFPKAGKLYVSPMKRCVQTAEILYPGQPFECVAEFAECNFGLFENKNADELRNCAEYQQWIDNNGKSRFPNGESKEHFLRRCIAGLDKVAADCKWNHYDSAALVVHGGTVMNLMESYGSPRKAFYEWHIENASCYEVEMDMELWKTRKRALKYIKSI
ncbi:MAG: histidine phosphatase family protein [Eubacterium sp.]|nr:histidine phosphatase family protein [Eubacterium sp.]